MTLPHEQLLTRRFVLIPSLELDFELTAPDGTRLADALAGLSCRRACAGPVPRWSFPALHRAELCGAAHSDTRRHRDGRLLHRVPR